MTTRPAGVHHPPMVGTAAFDSLATKADLAALETRLTMRFYGALLAMAAVMIAATAAFTKL